MMKMMVLVRLVLLTFSLVVLVTKMVGVVVAVVNRLHGQRIH